MGRRFLTAGFAAFLLAPASVAQQSSRFAPVSACRPCHSRIEKPENAIAWNSRWTPPPFRAGARPGDASIAPGALFAGGVMAHSSRDPYWLAKVRSESAATPAAAETIEDTCLRCHAPQQQYEAHIAGRKLRLSDLDEAGREGVGCTVCHQITAKDLGSKASFAGSFTIETDHAIYGPHAEPFTMPMAAFTGYTPTEGKHILDAALCGSCHTVLTPVLDAAGKNTGEFIEQGTYLEWLRSSYPRDGQTCQACHAAPMRDDKGELLAQFIAHTPGGGRFGPIRPRSPFGLHFFQGANLQLLGMLRELFPEETAALELTIQRTRESLASAAALDVRPSFTGSMLEAAVTITNRTGHKLPTGFPSRRIWLHVQVEDRYGSPVFESGRDGGSPGELHRNVITAANETAVFESEMRDPAGRQTVTLLRASGYAKDNRILPKGYDATRALPDGINAAGIAPEGVTGDSDFVPGADTVHYRIDTSGATGPFRLTVELLYQSIKPSHTAAMVPSRSSEEAAFLSLYPRHSAPALVQRRELVVSP